MDKLMNDPNLNSWLIFIFGILVNIVVAGAFFAFRRMMAKYEDRHEQRAKRQEMAALKTDAILHSLLFSADNFSVVAFRDGYNDKLKQLTEEYKLIHDMDVTASR